MRCILNTRTEPEFNLAAEEQLLRRGDEDIFMLWRNAPAVIVGRHQNTAAEIDEDFVRRRGIKVIRRMTGGGAVFHDLGNVNFTFIRMGDFGRGIDFRRFTAPILEALRALGVEGAFDGRNDLTAGGKKFSGNAQHVERDRVLHHGTLLFSSSLEDMTAALRVRPEKFSDKAVKSLPARVTMLKNFLPHLDVETFMRLLMERMLTSLPGERRDLDAEEERAVEEAARSKYALWEWNYGKSPEYAFRRYMRTAAGTLEARLHVRSGVILAACIRGDFFALRPVEELEGLLAGRKHEAESLATFLESICPEEYIQGLAARELAACLV